MKELTSKNKGHTAKTIMNKQGALLKEPGEINQKRKAYLGELYNKEGRPGEIEMEEEADVERDQTS